MFKDLREFIQALETKGELVRIKAEVDWNEEIGGVIEEALRIEPESSAYLNTKGLLLSDGLAKHRQALDCLTRALEFEPDSVVIGQNIRNVEQLEQRKHQSKGCLGLLLVLASSGFGVCAVLSILCMS